VSDDPAPARRPVNPFFRLIVAVFGLTFLGLGSALVKVGGIVGVGLGVVMILLGLAVIVIAVGLVEWWAGLRR
jgi:hypothetical protein